MEHASERALRYRVEFSRVFRGVIPVVECAAVGVLITSPFWVRRSPARSQVHPGMVRARAPVGKDAGARDNIFNYLQDVT